MAALGIPTTRALAAVTTGEPVLRETALPGAVLTRVAASHIRVGTFQYFAARGDVEARAAARRLRDRPPLPGGRAARRSPIARCSTRVVARQAALVARWLLRRLHPRRDEHRQHVDLRRDDRLRPVRVHGRLRSRRRCSARSTTAAATPTATSRAIAQWNLARLGRDAAAAARPTTRTRRWRRRDEALGGLRPALRGGLARRPAAQARPARREREGDAALAQDLLERHGRERRRLHPDLPRACATRRAGPEADAASARCSRTPAPSTPGPRAGAARLAEEPGDAGGAPRGDAGGQPGLHPAQPPRRGGARRRRRAAGLRAVRGAARRPGAALRGAARPRRATPRRRGRRSASARPSAAPEARADRWRQAAAPAGKPGARLSAPGGRKPNQPYGLRPRWPDWGWGAKRLGSDG